MTLGDIILNYRNSFTPKISQRDFAKRCGLSHTYIAALEKNIDARTNKPIAPTLDTVKYISKGIGITVEEILKMLDDEQEFVMNKDISNDNLYNDKSAVVLVYGTIPAGIPIECIEDIIDTGLTLNFLYNYLKNKDPKTLKICALLDKKERRQKNIHIDYTGFQIKNKFVVGYGLDFDEKYRNLSYIGYIGD